VAVVGEGGCLAGEGEGGGQAAAAAAAAEKAGGEEAVLCERGRHKDQSVKAAQLAGIGYRSKLRHGHHDSQVWKGVLAPKYYKFQIDKFQEFMPKKFPQGKKYLKNKLRYPPLVWCAHKR